MVRIARIEFYQVPVVGDWNLNKYGVSNVIIPRSMIQSLKTSSENSQGVLKKFNLYYRRTNNYLEKAKTLYVKAGVQRGGVYSTLEPVTEALCSEIGIFLGFDVLPVNLWTINTKLLDKVEEPYGSSFTSERTLPPSPTDLTGESLANSLDAAGLVLVGVTESYIEKDEIYKSCNSMISFHSEKDLYDKCASQGKTVGKYIDQMLLFDFLVNNPDRHSSNFGFLWDYKDESDESVLSPLIDHGLALFSSSYTGDLGETNIEKYTGHDCFRNLLSSLELINKDNLLEINFKVEIEELHSIVDKYADLLEEKRVRLIKEMLRRRWTYAQQKFHS